jgi:Spy/CpxP family protein refolding chaperone
LNALKVDASRIGLSLPIPTAEQQQVELAKQIAAPVEPAPAEAPAAPSETITPAVEAAPVTPAPTEAPAITPAPVAETPAVAPAPEVAPAPTEYKGKVKREYESGLKAGETAMVKPTGVSQEAVSAMELDDMRKDVRAAKDKSAGNAMVRAYRHGKTQGRVNRNAPVFAEAVESYNITLPEGYTKQGDLYVYQPATAPAEAAPVGIAVGNRIKLGKSPQTYTVEEVIPQSETERGLGEQFYSVKNERTGEVQTVEAKDLKPVLARVRRGEKGGVLFLTREDFIQAGQNIYEAGMEFATWARQMVQRFGDAVRQFLGDIWQAVSGIPAKVNELAGFLPGKGEAGAVAFGRGEEPPKPPKKPAEPAAAPEKPAVEKKPTMKRYDKKSQVAGVPGIGAAIDTPKGINARTEKTIQDRVFNSDIVNDNQTKKAWNLIQNLESTNPSAGKNAEAINQLTRETMQDVDADEVVKQTIGAVKLRNELFKYAMKLTAQGDKKMLDYLLNIRLAFGGGTIVEGDPGRLLQAHQSLKNWIVRASEAERQGFFEAAAQQFFDTKTPTDEQIQQIKDIFNKVNDVKIDQEKELMTELEEVGKAAGIDLPAIVQKQLDAAPGLDPMVVAMTAMQRLYGGTITTQYEPISKRAQGRIEGVKKIIQGGISNYRKKLVSKGANGLETGFWKTLATTEEKPGPLGELDAAQNRALGNIVKSTLVSLGLKGTPPDTKMSIYEQVASILGEQPLGKDKMNLADEKIRGGIEAGRNAELENATEDQADAINSKWDAIQFAWDESMSRSLDMPVSDTMLRRLIANEIKDEKTSIQELATLMDEEPAIGTSRQDRLVNSIIEKVSGITFDGQPTRDYTALKKYLSDMLENIVQARQQKNAAAKSVAKVKRDASGDPDKQAQAQIDKLAKIQADPTIFGEKKIDPVRNAVRDALSLKLNIGFTPEQSADIKRNWKGAYVADPNKKGIPTSFMLEMQRLGVSEAAADTLSEIVWRQIEVNAMNRQMEATTKAVEAGPIGGMVQAILDTPLANQQDPDWRKQVILDYLKNAGIRPAQAENIAKLFDLSLRKRFAKAQEEAAIKAAKSIKGGLNPASKRALEKFLKAIRAQVLDPGTDVAKAFGEQMGWTGFTAEQITKLNELDAIVNDTNKTDAEIAVAIEQINKIIDKVSAPPQVKDIIASYYVGNILGRITTFTIQALDPLAFTTFNAAVESFRNITNPQQLMSVWSNYGRGISNLIRETAFSFKNDVLRSGKIVDYMARQDRQIGRLWDEAERKWKAGDIKGAMKDGIFGYTAWTFRTLKALDDGAYSLLTTTTLPSYVDAALKRARVPAEKRRGVMRGILEARELDIKNMVEQGTPRNDAIVYANEKMRGEVTKVLTGMNIDAQEVIDASINDALSRIGKTSFKEDIHGKETEIKDLGFISSPLLRFYEAVAKSVNEKGGSESQKIFYRILLGFPLIPARIFNIAAGYTPLTIYRHFLKNRYSLTYGTALQRRQRIIEQMAGTAALLPLLLLRSNSLDEEDEKEKGFGVYITGQGPSRTMDRETRAQWDKKFDPYSIVFRVGNKSASIDARAAGPLSVMIYTLGAIDDWENRRKQEGLKTSKDDWRDVHEKASLFTAMYDLAGSFLLTTARRGPTTGVIQGLIDFKSYPDDPIAAISKEVAFSGMPAVPVLGTGIVKNLSDLFSQPIDNKTKEGAILSNIPIVGPVAGQPALNAYGQRIGELRVSEKLKKSFGLPFTLITSDTEDDTKITSLTLKFGNGPTPIRRDEVENALKDVISDEEWYLAAKTFGSRNKEKVLAAYNRYDKMKPDRFNDAMNKLTTDSKNAAIRAVKQQRRNRP